MSTPEKCARCAHFIKPGTAAQSRVEPVHVCSDCGMDEAVFSWAYGPDAVPPLGHKIVWPTDDGAGAARTAIGEAARAGEAMMRR